MKKIYSKPEIKTVVLEESLMNDTSQGDIQLTLDLEEREEEGYAE